MTDFRSLRHQSFRRDYLAWTTLHHFLPADLIRELSIATIAVIAPWSSLDELFDEALSNGNSAQAIWALAPRRQSDPELQFLQAHIRALAWANDVETAPSQPRGDVAVDSPARALSAATRLGRFDFGSRRKLISQLPLPDGSSGRKLADLIATAIKAHNGDDSDWAIVRIEAERLPSPLRTLSLKHVGDLCADADLWDEAARFYERANAGLTDFSPEWTDFGGPLADIIGQSVGSAVWVTDGAEIASSMLDRVSRPSSGEMPSLGALNGSHDALVARLARPGNKDWEDIRATVMLPPLLIQSFDVGQAVESWLKGGMIGRTEPSGAF